MSSVLQSAWFRGAVSGAIAGLVVDIQAFKSWQAAHDGSQYDWAVALTRIATGAVTGAVGNAGVGAALGG